MSRIGLGETDKRRQTVTFTSGEKIRSEVTYRLGWYYYQDRIVAAWIPVEVNGMPLTDVRYENKAWTANECTLPKETIRTVRRFKIKK